jgi:hypothetical protein
VTQELLDGFQVPGLVEHTLTGCVAGFVHPFAAGHPFRDDTASREAAVPPVMEAAVVSHWLVGEAVERDFCCLACDRVEPPRDGFLAAEEVVPRLRFHNPRAEQRPGASMSTEQLEVTEARKLLRWRRFAELISGGFDPSDALVLSTDPEINVRQAVDLLARGCPRTTLFRILL